MNKEQLKSEIQAIIEGIGGDITSDEIYAELVSHVDPGRTQETIRKIIRELVNDSALIGSSNTGYFKIKDISDVKRAISYLENRIPEIEMRIQNIKDAWNSSNPSDDI